MATPNSKDPEAFSAYVDFDSGVSTAKTADEHNSHLPPPAARPRSLSQVTPGVAVQSEAIPSLETAEGSSTLTPDTSPSNSPPASLATSECDSWQQSAGAFSVEQMVSPKEEVNLPGFNGADTMVGWDHSSRDREGYEVTIANLKEQLRYSDKKNNVLVLEFEVAKAKYDAVIAQKNKEIENLKSEKEEYKSRLLKVQNRNKKEKEAYQAKIDDLTCQLELKEEEINRIKDDFKATEQKHQEEKAKWKKEVDRIQMECLNQKHEKEKREAVLEAEKANLRTQIAEQNLKISEMKINEMKLQCELDKANKNTAVAEKTIAEERQKKAEGEAAKMKEENCTIKAENAALEEEKQAITERLNSITSSLSSSDRSSRRFSDIDGSMPRLNSQGSYVSTRSGSTASLESRRFSDAANQQAPPLSSQISLRSEPSAILEGELADFSSPQLYRGSQCPVRRSKSDNSGAKSESVESEGLTFNLDSQSSMDGPAPDSPNTDGAKEEPSDETEQ